MLRCVYMAQLKSTIDCMYMHALRANNYVLRGVSGLRTGICRPCTISAYKSQNLVGLKLIAEKCTCKYLKVDFKLIRSS